METHLNLTITDQCEYWMCYQKSMRDYFIIVFWNISTNISYCMNCILGLIREKTFNRTCTYLPNISATEMNEFAVAVFLDLSRAFDMVDHQILLKKLEHYGIRGVPLKWLSSYLSGRQQYVNFQNIDSDKMFIKRGVPQGSILAPLFFFCIH